MNCNKYPTRYQIGMKGFVLDDGFLGRDAEPHYYFGLRRKPRGGGERPALDLIGGRIDQDDASEMSGFGREGREEVGFKIILHGDNAPLRVGTQSIHWGDPRRHVIRKIWLARLAWDSPQVPNIDESEEFSAVESLTIPEAIEYGLDPSLDKFCTNPANIQFDTLLRNLGGITLFELGRRLVQPPVQSFNDRSPAPVAMAS